MFLHAANAVGGGAIGRELEVALGVAQRCLEIVRVDVKIVKQQVDLSVFRFQIAGGGCACKSFAKPILTIQGHGQFKRATPGGSIKSNHFTEKSLGLRETLLAIEHGCKVDHRLRILFRAQLNRFSERRLRRFRIAHFFLCQAHCSKGFVVRGIFVDGFGKLSHGAPVV